MIVRPWIVFAAAVLAAGTAAAQTETAPAAEPRPEEITLELIMSDPDWIGNAPESPYWADDGQSVYYEQKRQGEENHDLIHVDLEGNVLAVVADEERGAAGVAGGDWSRDRRFKVYSREGDVFWKDVATGEIRQLTRTVEPETRPHFLVGDRRVAFHRGDAVFVRDLESGLEYQAADVRLAEDPAEEKEPEDYLSRQQQRLIQWVREQQEKAEQSREREREARAADPTRVPPAWYLGDKIALHQSQLSPSGDWMLLAVADKNHDRGRQDRMPSYISEDGYVSVRDVRPLVGTGDGKGERLLLLDLSRHEKHELDLSTLPGITEDPLAELKRRAEERRKETDAQGDEAQKGDEGQETAEEKEDAKPRQVVFFNGIRFSPDGRYAAVMARSLDNKDRWIALVERPAEGQEPALETIHRLHDEAWINWSFNDFGWLDDSRRIYFLSEESGWSQLYLYSLDDGETRRLTHGDFVVDEPQPSPDQTYIYYQANRDHPGVYEIFRVALASGESERLTTLEGRNSAVLSPDGQRLLVTHSTTTRPPELYLQDAWQGGQARQLTHTVSEASTGLPWVAPQIVEVPSSHQERPIYARFYPAANDATRDAGGKRAAVLFVHGAGYLQNAHQGWSDYFREFMFHTLLSRHGYLVLDMDYRASAGYGRDWRTAIYRRMGHPEVEDLADGVDWLVSRHGVDRGRVGVYGGSYGGFLTFMALFTEPELFACGAALRPVADWAHYNHPYTSNILNTPDVDPEAYERSSPIEYAEGLARPLLMCSGMQDDNVFFQDTVRLVQRLIELGKEDWEVAFYPIESHGFREPSSWLDEYRRIFKLFQRHLAP